ncbi:MAG: secretin N-terminal domain-containing protein, partial [Deltaproteobacteria bacterium]
MNTNLRSSCVLLAIAALTFPGLLFGQVVAHPAIQEAQPAAQGPATPAEGTPAAAPEGRGGPRKPGHPAVGPDGKPIAGPEQPGAKPGEAPKPEAPKTSQRPKKPAVPPNPEELKDRPDDRGRVRFNFQGQPWLGVLEWLASISHLSLDWQEMPADFLNLRTQRSYTVSEARDLINRHLLDRGFTLLKHGEVLTVVNIKKLDPSLVPRVAPDDLDDRDPHEFVKVSFPLDSLTAEAATEELKPMMSPNGRLSALKATNRIEALDAVVNLREIRDVLTHEQSHRGRKRLVQQFSLQYTRASDMLEQLQELLGLEKKKSGAVAPNPQQQMMQQQMEQQMMQQRGGQGGPPAPAKQAPSVHLVVNPRENAIVATAPADQMAIIAEAVKIIDVPSSRSQSLLKNMNRTQVYRLASIDPEPLVKMLQELGDLDPATHLQIDKKNKSIIAYAPLADHLTIRTLVNKLDGTDRKFEVIRLRRLEADYVAGSIEFMMGGGDKKKNQPNNRFYPFFDFYGGGRNNEQEDDSKKFRVDADVEHNRLLLWANPVELEEINHLLVKLGEIPPEGGNSSTLRVLDSIPPEEVDQLLERLRRTWPGVGRNPLEVVPPADEADAADEPPAKKSPPRQKAAPAKKRPGETNTEATPGSKAPAVTFATARVLPLVQVTEKSAPDAAEEDATEPARSREPSADAAQAPAEDDADAAPVDEDGGVEPSPRVPGKSGGRSQQRPRLATPAPIRVGRDPDGRMIISSPDTQALDRLEDLLAEITPPRKDYKVFKMKYKSTWAYGVALNLKDFFEEKDKNDQRRNRPWFFGGQNGSDDERRLSKRRPLKFIADSDSNSILVSGADAAQLKIVEELIALYDIPESKDSAAVRKTKIVQVNYSKARVIADAVKDVYRDLLSANDPALQNNNQNNKDQKQKAPEAMYTYIYNSGGDDKKH